MHRTTPPADQIVVGRNALLELLRHDPERIQKILIERKTRSDARFKEIFDLIQTCQLEFEEVSPERLESYATGLKHQSFVALLHARPKLDLKQFLTQKQNSERSLVLLLDSINDPQNFGALLRAAECFAADAVIYSKNRGCGVTPVVSKSSAGASELVNLIAVSNLVDALDKLQKAGFWLLAADAQETAQNVLEYEFPQKVALVLGSEGAGLQPLILKKVDLVLSIPLYGRLQSLNVSQACAVMLFAYRQSLSAAK